MLALGMRETLFAVDMGGTACIRYGRNCACSRYWRQRTVLAVGIGGCLQ